MSKSALVTGASRGIGRATALRLAQMGFDVAVLARNEAELSQLGLEIEALDRRVLVLPTDVSDAAAVESAVDQALGAFGQIDVAVNNAGIGAFGPIETLSVEEFDRVMAVNVRGLFALGRAVAPHFKARKSGTFVTIASDVAKRTFDGGTIYCASKYAQEGLTSALRREFRPFGVRVCGIYPGLVDTHFDTEPSGLPRKATWLRDHDIADAVAYAVGAPEHVIVDEVLVHPMSQDW